MLYPRATRNKLTKFQLLLFVVVIDYKKIGGSMQVFINQLVLVGLTENEAKAYLLLLHRPLTATRIAKEIKVNRSNVYGIISSLVQKGFLREIDAKVRTIVAVNPRIAFNSLKTTHRMRIKLMDKLSEELFPYFKAEAETSKRELIKIIHTNSRIISTLEKLEQEAKQEVLAFSKPPYLMDVDDLESLNLPQRESSRRGVRYCAVHQSEPGNEQHFIRRMEYFASLGEEVYISESLPMKLFIFDSEIAVFTMENNSSSLSNFTFASFENSDLAKTFTQIFELYKSQALSLAAYKAKINFQEEK